MKKIITLFVALVTLSITAQDSVLLRLKYNVGSIYYTKMQVIQDAPMMKNNMTMEMKTKVNSIKDGIVETENSFEKIIVDVEAQGKKIKYSSEMKEAEMSPTAKIMHPQMKDLKEAIVLMYFNERGKMENAKIKSGKQSYLQSFKEVSPVEYPKEAVKVGSTWKKTVSKNGMDINSIYTVKSISTKEVTLDVVGSVSGLGTGEVKGITIIDKLSGHTLKSNVDMTISTGGMDVNMKVSVTSSKI